MDGRTGNLRRLEAVAAAQHRAFTRVQATAEGFSPSMQSRRRRRGAWVSLLPGISRFAGATPTFRMRCMAAVLWSAPDGYVSHTTAAALWDLEGIRRPLETHLTLPRDRRLESDAVCIHRVGDLLPADRSIVFGIAVSSPLRTVLDVAGMLDPGDLEMRSKTGCVEGCSRSGSSNGAQCVGPAGGARDHASSRT